MGLAHCWCYHSGVMPNLDARSDDLPSGLVFFRPSTPAAVRRRRWTLVAVLVTAAIALTWPVYSFFSVATPLILGLPLSLAWGVLWALVIFVSLAWLFWFGDEEGAPFPDDEPSAGEDNETAGGEG